MLAAVAPAGDVELDDQAAAVLTASRALLGVVAHSLAPALEQVTLPQFRVLMILSTQGAAVRTGALADALGVQASTFTRTADRLVSGGWVRRIENPGSRREILIDLTAKGSRLVTLVTTRRQAEITRVLRRMDRAQREQARAGLDAFARAAGEPSAADLGALGI